MLTHRQQRLRVPLFLLINIVLTQIHDAYLWYLNATSGLTCGSSEAFSAWVLYITILLEPFASYYELIKEDPKRCLRFHRYRRWFEVGLGLWVLAFLWVTNFHFECVQVIHDRGWTTLNWGRWWPNLVVYAGLSMMEQGFNPTRRGSLKRLYANLTFYFLAWLLDYPGSLWCLTGTGLIIIDWAGETLGFD